MTPTKTCSKCKVEKPFSEFNKNNSSKDGLQRYCRLCNKGYGRNYHKQRVAKKYGENGEKEG